MEKHVLKKRLIKCRIINLYNLIVLGLMVVFEVASTYQLFLLLTVGLGAWNEYQLGILIKEDKIVN